MHKVTFKIRRDQICELHEWLDQYCDEWRYGLVRASKAKLYGHDPQYLDCIDDLRTERFRCENEDYCLSSMEHGTGGHLERVSVRMSPPNAVMLARLTWEDVLILDQ